MKSIVRLALTVFSLSTAVAAEFALADDTFILATGRRDPRIYAIDFKAALNRHNNNTPNAIVSRSKVHPDRLDGTPVGDPANIVLTDDRRTAYVVNHHGAVDNAEFLQHGGRGSVAVMDLEKMIRREFDDTDRALERDLDSGYFGAVGLVILPERCSEPRKTGDRGRLQPHQARRPQDRKLQRQIGCARPPGTSSLCLRSRSSRDARRSFPRRPIERLRPNPRARPRRQAKTYLSVTRVNDVSVMDWQALAGVHRRGRATYSRPDRPWHQRARSAHPPSRPGSGRSTEGNTISIIDVIARGRPGPAP
jgi:hypothetical protein